MFRISAQAPVGKADFNSCATKLGKLICKTFYRKTYFT